MDHELIAEKGNRFRYSASGKPGDYVDILCSPDTMQGLARRMAPFITWHLQQQMMRPSWKPVKNY